MHVDDAYKQATKILVCCFLKAWMTNFLKVWGATAFHVKFLLCLLQLLEAGESKKAQPKIQLQSDKESSRFIWKSWDHDSCFCLACASLLLILRGLFCLVLVAYKIFQWRN